MPSAAATPSAAPAPTASDACADRPMISTAIAPTGMATPYPASSPDTSASPIGGRVPDNEAEPHRVLRPGGGQLDGAEAWIPPEERGEPIRRGRIVGDLVLGAECLAFAFWAAELGLECLARPRERLVGDGLVREIALPGGGGQVPGVLGDLCDLLGHHEGDRHVT